MSRFSRFFAALGICGLTTACGTTYQLPELGAGQSDTATRMFAEARAEGPRQPLSAAAAERRFQRVAARIQPTGRRYCETLAREGSSIDCNVALEIDRKMKQRNAYFTYDGKAPVIRISMPMLQDSASDDEVAFILGHEYGHLIGRHIQKQQQQALAGALILGVITAAATANASSYNPNTVSQSMDLGAAAGSMAYSQTYELESDTLGTRIADAAGYDPVKGAKFFARSEAARTTAGNLSFWGTHPPDAKRLATVLATKQQIDANIGLQKVQ
ncbi:M48 family metallopeptidase [Pseudodonghicola flavimaris]|uniref:M48 family metallopeptidase n=1 Tax=Pseudodonghicola flavimaris TaxID=3050036 RepID=A0ABT7EYM0_9RHOB|nr:M48 family metallopeptidase [Pseudodonghicola flavimaris]MDK3017441.1 M48 family metallopeptidase [Pseudodonghicola flavimaris]